MKVGLFIILGFVFLASCETPEVGLSYTVLEEENCDTCEGRTCEDLGCPVDWREVPSADGEQQSI